MRVLVLGATRGTGRHVVQQALARGYHVTAVARNPAALGIEHDDLVKIACDVTADVEKLGTALQDQDVVICTLGAAGLRSDHLIERSVKVFLPAMEAHGPRRLIFLSAFGVGESINNATFPLSILFRTLLGDIYRDKVIGETLVAGSSLDWTIVQPVKLTDGPPLGRYEFGDNLSRTGFRSVTRADVAEFLLRCTEDSLYSLRTIVVRS